MSAPGWLETIMRDINGLCFICASASGHNRVCRWGVVEALIEEMGEALRKIAEENQYRSHMTPKWAGDALAAYEKGPTP